MGWGSVPDDVNTADDEDGPIGDQFFSTWVHGSPDNANGGGGVG